MNTVTKCLTSFAIAASIFVGTAGAASASSSTVVSGSTRPTAPVPGRLTCKMVIKMTQDVWDTVKAMDARGEDSTSMRETGEMLITTLDDMNCAYTIYTT